MYLTPPHLEMFTSSYMNDRNYSTIITFSIVTDQLSMLVCSESKGKLIMNAMKLFQKNKRFCIHKYHYIYTIFRIPGLHLFVLEEVYDD